MSFPYGKAPLAILLVALVSSVALLSAGAWGDGTSQRPDLVFATFTKDHAASYRPAIAEFERTHNCKIQLQVVSQRALQGRLQGAMQAGADVPDMVELLYGTLGTFTRGPVTSIGFVDLTERVERERLKETMVANRFGQWSTRGRVFAIPHDVHPVMLAYRRDLVEQLGIDVSKLATWQEFCRIGRENVTRDLDGDGVNDRYMLDLPADGSDTLRLLILQRGASMFAADGNVAFDDERTLDVICWYVKQVQGAQRIAFSAGWGQTLSRAMLDGLCLFYFCPDWRTGQIEIDIPSLAGKMAVMPLPAWTEGGVRTSVWGGTGLAITKQCRQPDLAWKLAMHLYTDRAQLGPRFDATNILPPLKDAWNDPAFARPDPFWGGQSIGSAYAALAPSVPEERSSAYMTLAVGKMSEAFMTASQHYARYGESGLRDAARAELKRCADHVRKVMDRNVFLKREALAAAAPNAGEGAP